MKAVLLASGLAQTPWPGGKQAKRAQRVNASRPLIDVAIESFVMAGFDEVGVVLQENQDLLQCYLEDGSRYGVGVYTIRSENSTRGRAASILSARTFAGGESFVLASETARLDPGSLQSLVRLAWAPCALGATKRTSRYPAANPGIRLWLDRHGRVEQAGDAITRWNAVADDVFLFQPEVFQVISTLLQAPEGRCSISHLLRHLIHTGQAPQACLARARWDPRPQALIGLRAPQPMLSVLFSPEYLSA